MKIILIVLGGLLVLLTIPRLLMKFNGLRMKGKEAPTSHKASRKRIRAGKKTLLYFYTSSCGACNLQESIIQQAQKRYPDTIFKIDASQNRKVATDYKVMGVPFIAFIENGTITKATAGVQRESTIEGFLAK